MSKNSQKSRSSSNRVSDRSLKVLFVDDEIHLQELIAAEVPRMGHEVTVCANGQDAIKELNEAAFDCLLVDLDMPGMNGIEVIEVCKKISPTTEAVVLTGKGSTETAIAALRLGAFDYLQKPCRLVELKSLFQRIADRRSLNHQIHSLKMRLERAEGRPLMIGQHPRMQRVKALIEKVAPTPSTVLIVGETGTGKELAARAVHQQSTRSEHPFVPINCGALPENLIESELFGHRKGAFTGADEHRKGLFEVANGGTLFLDEVAELPRSTQSTLLRVLESGEIKRVGESKSLTVDVRVICATHRNLQEMVSNDEFREDLMYRINTFEVLLPPLRERAEDIPELAMHLLQRFRNSLQTPRSINKSFDKDAIEKLMQYGWPGNIRELANVIEYASIINEQLPISSSDFPSNFGQRRIDSRPKSLREIELETIWAALDHAGGNKTEAARQLGISIKTLYNKLNAEANQRKAG